MSVPKIPTRKLNDGTLFPLIAYGTGTALYKRSNLDQIDQSTVDTVKTAIRLGLRHLDCAELYNTEPEVGVAIRESGLPRESFYITTKVINSITDIPGAINASLSRLGVDYVDLYLIHSPWFAKSGSELQSAWAEMEKVQASGKAKSIGVSNYLIEHLETTMETAKVVPAVNQVEFHPYLQRQNLVPWSDGKGIATSAFGPLSTTRKGKPGPVDGVVEKLAKKYEVGEEAVCLRWCMQQGQGVAAITTSSKEERLKGYLGAVGFELTKEEVQEICDKGSEKHMRCNHFMHQWPEDDKR